MREHDREDDQHEDAADVDQDLGRREEVGLHDGEEGGDREEHDQEREGGADDVAAGRHRDGARDRGRREDVEDDVQEDLGGAHLSGHLPRGGT